MDRSKKKTSRLCVLMPEQLRAALDELCRTLDTTASQAVRQLVKRYVDTRGNVLEPGQRGRR